MRANLLRLFGLSVCALLAPAAHALEPIDTDGPNFVGSSEVVPTGHFQYGLDMTSASDSRSGSQTANVSAPLLLKYGVGNVFELRVDTDGIRGRTANPASATPHSE